MGRIYKPVRQKKLFLFISGFLIRDIWYSNGKLTRGGNDGDLYRPKRSHVGLPVGERLCLPVPNL